MTTLPTKQNKKLGLVIDLDICVGCHACAVNCKEWNTSGHSSPLHDIDPYGDDPTGVWFNRIHTFEVESEINGSKTVHFLKAVYIAVMLPALPYALQEHLIKEKKMV